MTTKPSVPFLSPGFGASLLVKIGVLTIATSLLVAAMLYQLTKRDLGTDFRSSFYTLKGIDDYLIPIIGFSLLVFTVVAGTVLMAVGILLSHRVAGPLYRIELSLREIERGDFSPRISFRSSDQLKPLAEGMNGWIGHLDEKTGLLQNEMASIREELKQLQRQFAATHGLPGDFRARIETLNHRLANLRLTLTEI